MTSVPVQHRADPDRNPAKSSVPEEFSGDRGGPYGRSYRVETIGY